MTLHRYTKLKATKPLNRKSLRKIYQENSEVEDRIALCHRAKGTPIVKKKIVKLNNNSEIENTTVLCTNGICEECGQFHLVLEPHEDGLRARGAKVSLEESIMVGRECHNKLGSKPQWSKK